MFDQYDQPDEYEMEDLGWTYTVSPLGEIVTDPGLAPSAWFVKHGDPQGIYFIPLDEELVYYSGDDPLWNVLAKAVYNKAKTVVMIFKLGTLITVEKDRHMLTLLHRSVVGAYTKAEDK